ncbi:hypothetical protein [Halorientalis pallida]|uniref:hypothetical protein n=1 Tax=Halorientalis pallida TaxID=2479928 RepID=UPI001D117E36|nr:hypothetical protein [Halorientalis pallida]
MVDVMGHVAMGLLWGAPAWFCWRRRVSLAVGAVVATQRRPLDRWLWREPVTPRVSFGFVALAVLIGGLSHLFADVLSSPDIAQPLEPF